MCIQRAVCIAASALDFSLTPNVYLRQENMQQGNIEDKYVTKKLLGKGAYASVWSSVNQETKQYCAIKCIDFEEVSRDKIDKTIAQVGIPNPLVQTRYLFCALTVFGTLPLRGASVE